MSATQHFGDWARHQKHERQRRADLRKKRMAKKFRERAFRDWGRA